ncbi:MULTISPECIES: polysaccharide deacetylase family protein [unclassified Bradyrhizobium]|uniref:polysaccharide deacetylase family protein n=1 Tax=unclassified Bradyrhizobium TaxID=2631580 RepID=UPI0020129F2B|nr:MULTISPECIES: polysaccharide deacetylase family protein [unclassified Bradyrhizobium]
MFLGMLTGVSAQAAPAANCPGHPDAIGTSRTLVVDPRQYPLIGTMQYAKTLPLEDHEVVLTFDDGPLPKYSNQILDILAAHCAKATFFLVGRQANANPEGVRKMRDAGHTIATHTQNHPGNMNRLSIDGAKKEIEDGIASITSALADGTAPSPFFRIPGLGRSDVIEAYAEAKGLQIWSADFPADDWRPVSSQRVYDLAMQRLEAKGKGILLLHDIQARTVAALPRILSDLKARGYRLVHVVPATPDRPATPTEPSQWQLHPVSEQVATSRWPKIPNFAYTATAALPAPALSDSDWRNTAPADRVQRRALRDALWSRQVTLVLDPPALPVPAPGVFKLPESIRVTMLYSPPSARKVEPTAPAAHEVSAKQAARPAKHAKHGGKGAAKHAQVKPAKKVRMAGLKKR